MTSKSEKEDSILGELSDIGFDIIEKVSDLEAVNYDSPSTRAELKAMLESYWKLSSELDKVD